MTKPSKQLTIVDLQLFLAGAMPPGKSLMMRLALFKSPTLRRLLRQVKSENRRFRKNEFHRLKLRCHMGGARQPGRPQLATETDNGLQRFFSPMTIWKPVLVTASLLISVSAIFYFQRTHPNRPQALMAAKGGVLGVNLMVKGNTGLRVQNYRTVISPTDTLQVVPVGLLRQYLTILTWDPDSGLAIVYPVSGNESPVFSSQNLPPSLVAEGLNPSKLICVTSAQPVMAESVRQRVSRAPFDPINNAPDSFLDKKIYYQIYTIRSTE